MTVQYKNMDAVDFFTKLFCHVEDAMPEAKKHSQANLCPREVVKIAILFSLKGVGNQAFYHCIWVCRSNLFAHVLR